jgi:membrane-associated protease RseP (regulator of RpoE activity)
VWDASGPVPDATVALYTPTGVRHARTDEEGAFLLDNLGAAPSRLLVHKSGLVPAEERVDIAGDPADVIDLGRIELDSAGSVSGQVLDPNDEPIAGAWISQGRVPTYLPLGPLPLGMTSTDRSGRFVLRDVAPGRVTVEAYAPGVGRSAVDGVVVRADELTEDLRIVVEPEEESSRPEGAGSLAVTLSEATERGQAVVVIVHVPQGGEAEQAGIEPGDRLLAVDGARIRSIEQARRRLTGPLSEDVVLLLARDPDLRWLLRVGRERLRR